MIGKVYQIYIDILGFEELASEIAKKSGKKPDIVRDEFITILESELQKFKKSVSLEYEKIGPDSWLLQTNDDILKVLDAIQKIMEVKTPPLEMAIGKTEIDPGYTAAHDDYTIRLVKNLTSSYKTLYKQKYGESIKRSFIVFADEVYDELCSHRSICLRISNAHHVGGELHYMTKADRKKHHLGVVINPIVFKSLALRKVYGFKRIDDYWTLKEELQEFSDRTKDASIGVHGIYGYHDILIQSYEPSSEDGKNRLTLRLWPILSGENDFSPENFGLAEVKGVIKYHGIKSEELETRLSSEDIHKYKKNFNLITTGGEIDSSIVDEMLDRNICIRTEYDLSDISEEEQKKGKTEFLVLAEVRGRNDSPVSPEDLFEQKVLNPLLDEHGHYVRTVERLRSNAESFVRAHFMIHVVGYLNDLNDILLNHIHKRSINHKEFDCKTQVVIPAEQITENRFPVLLEDSISPTKANRILEIIDKCKSKINDEYIIPPGKLVYPFAAYTIGDYDRKAIIGLYEIFDSIVFEYYDGDKDSYMKLYRFLYGIAEVLALAKVSDNRGIAACRVFKNERSQFINDIGEKIENTLKQVLDNILKDCKLEESELNSSFNLAIKLLMNREGKFDCRVVQIGDTGMGISAVAGVCLDEDKINRARARAEDMNELTKETIDQEMELLCKIYSELKKWFAPGITEEMYKNPLEITIKNLKGFSTQRNLFSHGRRTEEEKVQHIYDNLSDILQGVLKGVKYLGHINKQIGAIHGQMNVPTEQKVQELK